MGYDITKCAGQGCPLRADCYRYTSETVGRQDFFGSLPYDTAKASCEYFWDNSTQIQLRAYQIWREQGSKSHQHLDNWHQAKEEIVKKAGG
jgi:hypothetical protein